MFKSDRVHLSSEQENVQISWAGMRTNVGMYTRNNVSLNSTVGEDVILNLLHDVQADFMQATCVSTAVKVGNLETFYQGLQERWQVLPG